MTGRQHASQLHCFSASLVIRAPRGPYASLFIDLLLVNSCIFQALSLLCLQQIWLLWSLVIHDIQIFVLAIEPSESFRKMHDFPAWRWTYAAVELAVKLSTLQDLWRRCCLGYCWVSLVTLEHRSSNLSAKGLGGCRHSFQPNRRHRC